MTWVDRKILAVYPDDVFRQTVKREHGSLQAGWEFCRDLGKLFSPGQFEA
jgi:hypothetical protein